MVNDKNRPDVPKEQGAKSFTFSADPAFIEEVKSTIRGSFSQAVVTGLKVVLERSRKREPIRVPHKVGSLIETLEFDGGWIVPPQDSLEHVITTRFRVEDYSSIFAGDDDDPPPTRQPGELKPAPDPPQDEFETVRDRTWWAAALTAGRSFIWFSAKTPEEFAAGEINYHVQKEGELKQKSFSPVPQDIYDAVRQKAGTLLPPRRIG